MRLGDERESSNYVDETGRGGFGGGGGSPLGCLIPLVLSRFGIGGLVILLIGYFILSSLGGLGGQGGLAPSSQQVGAPAGRSTLDPTTRHFTLQVLASTEDTWGKLLGGCYTPTTLVFYSEADRSGCGMAQSAMGPFYCPNDQRIYLDTEFFGELARRFQAPGDFAMAYVIAHEVGHHVQDLTGGLGQAEQLQARASRTEGNAIQVKVELQADCLSGVWVNKEKQKRPNFIEEGDIDAALQTANAIGDDTLQRQAQGRVVPDSFTHGSAEQRKRWFMTGYQQGTVQACNTFGSDSP